MNSTTSTYLSQDQVVGPQSLCTTLQKNCTLSFSRYNSAAQPQTIPVRGNILQDQTMQVRVKRRNPASPTEALLWAQAIRQERQHHSSNRMECPYHSWWWDIYNNKISCPPLRPNKGGRHSVST
jgi:hypothetical protein